MRFCFAYLSYPNSNQGSGVGSYVRTLADKLAELGHEVVIVSLADKPTPLQQIKDHIQVVFCTPGQLHWYISKIPVLALLTSAVRELEYSYSVYRAVAHYHRMRRFDIIQATETGGVLLALLQRQLDTHLVIRLHGEKYTIYRHRPHSKVGLDLKLSRWLQLLAIKKTPFLLSPSRNHANNVLRELHNSDGTRITVIPDMVDQDVAGQSSAQDTPSQPDTPIVMYAGRLERDKGVYPLLEAAAQIVKQVPDVQFILVGSYHPTLSQADLMAFIEEHCLENNVRIMGYVDWPEMAALYRSATVFAMPSYYETFGLTFVEAMLIGKPVVGFSGSSLEEIIENNKSGVIVERGNIPALTETIVSLLKDSIRRETMGQAAHMRAITTFATSVVMPQLIEYYDHVVNAHQP